MGCFRFEAAWLLEETCESERARLWVASVGSVLCRLAYVSDGFA